MSCRRTWQWHIRRHIRLKINSKLSHVSWRRSKWLLRVKDSQTAESLAMHMSNAPFFGCLETHQQMKLLKLWQKSPTKCGFIYFQSRYPSKHRNNHPPLSPTLLAQTARAWVGWKSEKRQTDGAKLNDFLLHFTRWARTLLPFTTLNRFAAATAWLTRIQSRWRAATLECSSKTRRRSGQNVRELSGRTNGKFI